MTWLILFIIVLLVLLVLLQYWMLKRKRSKWSKKDQTFVRDNWKRIESMTDNRHQVLEADKLLDHMMRSRGFKGSVADMLKQHARQFSDLEALWQAHKLRNKLAHELDYGMSAGMAKNALNAFRRALKDLGLDL